MMARGATIVMFALAGCSSPIPDDAIPDTEDIRRLEGRLARHSCVGDLSQWERNYRFSRKAGLFSPYSLNPDLDVIEFHLRHVATISIKPGRHVLPPRPDGDWPDSNRIESIDGKFSLRSSSLSVSACKPLARR